MALTEKENRRPSGGSQGERGRERGGEAAALTPGSASKLATCVRGIHFPVSKHDLLRHVQDQAGCGAIQSMPDQSFDSVIDVMKAFSREK